jgi:hypothetical protein
MKYILTTLVIFALSIAALHAQEIDPVIQSAVNAAVPPQYAGYTSLAILGLMMLGRCIKALQNGSGLKGWLSAIWMGTNTPHVILGAFTMLSLASCANDPATGKPKFDAATLQKDALADIVAAGSGYLAGGKAGAVASLSAQELANLKAIADKLSATSGKNPAATVTPAL